jgi:probable HAF family extracellular repeat protein
MVDFSGVPVVDVEGVSGDGSTIVGRANFTGSGWNAFRWTAATGMISLGALPSTSVSEATGANFDGSVIVGFFGNAGYPGGGAERVFRWTAASGMVDLGALPLPGLIQNRATDVSADGSVVVGFCEGSSVTHAFRWTAATGMVDLGTAPGTTLSDALSVSADGSAVVGRSPSEGSLSRAMRWTASSGMRDLQDDLVNVYGLGSQLAGWGLVRATGVSADGRVIVGAGFDPGGYVEAWVARLDAPPQVTATQVNDGSVQRSRVTSLQVSFSTQVSFASTPGAAFTLTRVSDNASVSFTATPSIVGGVTVVTLNNFTGSATQFGSLADGRYTLTALASQISAGGINMTSNYTFGDAQGLYRFFGDINGDRHVDIADFGLFSTSIFNPANYIAAFDFNGDGHIDIADFGQFSLRFFTVLP